MQTSRPKCNGVKVRKRKWTTRRRKHEKESRKRIDGRLSFRASAFWLRFPFWSGFRDDGNDRKWNCRLFPVLSPVSLLSRIESPPCTPFSSFHPDVASQVFLRSDAGSNVSTGSNGCEPLKPTGDKDGWATWVCSLGILSARLMRSLDETRRK